MIVAWMRRPARRRYIEAYVFPAALQAKLIRELGDKQHADVALDGLRSWYLASLYANGRQMGMPSKAVDLAWHEMILMTREYEAFCRQAFGRFLHHTPEAFLSTPMDLLLGRTLGIVERRNLPMALFTADAVTGIADGTTWSQDALAGIRELDAAERRAGGDGGGGDGGDGGGDGGGCGGCGGCG
jgi:hypothetical protein